VYRWIRTPPYQRAIEYKPEKDRRMNVEEMTDEDRNWVVDGIRWRERTHISLKKELLDWTLPIVIYRFRSQYIKTETYHQNR
jgi:hypothetical protein